MTSYRKTKTIGILGGMGPRATVDLFEKIVANTSADCDQQHLPILIYNNPAIPPRSYEASGRTASPLPELIRTARQLEAAGADFIVMPCHTAHRWTAELRSQLAIPFLSMIEHTVSCLEEEASEEPILLLATETTIRHQLYPRAVRGTYPRFIEPAAAEQSLVDEAVARMKAGEPEPGNWLKPLDAMLAQYDHSGVRRYVAGCTEIPLLQKHLESDMTCIDPTLLLARLAVAKSLEN
ncbi:aspartate/glutamate racemase family protein [Paenibacillus daejeonensis]|uniref:aspartate/glutamate racemase family protein n=1 Tax=Paenibacillus daejeonensis TaxID=135193 RepID=UPI000373DF32|nr:amino acid racemase [Paenibacillus daejeonensis]